MEWPAHLPLVRGGGVSIFAINMDVASSSKVFSPLNYVFLLIVLLI